ncbi:hypothetical protein MRX96_035279 [Rhipicephalus microplus]
MQKSKMPLVTKMKEESRRHQEAEKRYKRQLAQMLKASCQQGNRFRFLQAQKHTKKTVLKRRHEEMAIMIGQTASRTFFKASPRRCSQPDMSTPSSRRTPASIKYRSASSNKKWRA